MKIHWVTFVCQVINFFVLVFLLKRFLYGPIIDAMDAREARIAKELEDAEKARKEADEREESYRKKERELEETQDALIAKAEEEAKEKKKELLREARSEVEDRQARWREALRQEQESFLKELRERSGEEIWKLSRRVLQDLATADLEEHVIEVFLERFDQEHGAGTEVEEALTASKGLVTVRSSFPIEDAKADQLEKELSEKIPGMQSIEWARSENLLAGIELKIAGYKIAWSIRDYLEKLEEEMKEVIEEESQRKSTPPRDKDESSSPANEERASL